MPEYFVKNTEHGLRPLSSAQRSQIKARWDAKLFSTVVSSLIMSARNHHRATTGHPFAIHGDVVFEGRDGNFVVRGTNMRATVRLNLVYLDAAAHATIDVATSWPVTEAQKRELERDKAGVLNRKNTGGRDLNGLVCLRYGACEAATEEMMRKIDEEAIERSKVTTVEKTLKKKKVAVDLTPEEEELLIAEMEEGIPPEGEAGQESEEEEEEEEEVKGSEEEKKGEEKGKNTRRRR